MPPPAGTYGARPPSHAAYYVALGGCLLLLLLLCCYLLYFCATKIHELSECESLTATTSTSARPAHAHSYAVQPVVRDSATAMAKLCKHLPATSHPLPVTGHQLPVTGKQAGDTVYPAASSPPTQPLGPTPTTPHQPLGPTTSQ